MDFRRGPNGLLGFGINEAGVVQKVDGVAKSTGLQTGSRLLQVHTSVCKDQALLSIPSLEKH